jgi:hypothetical protein
MSDVIQNYLDTKYSVGGPGSSRFDPDASEVHASQLSDCQRKRKWKHDRDHRSGPSPYFELGRVFEILYGAALAHHHDPDIDRDVLKCNPPWEVVEMTDVVVQDVNVTIDIGTADIVGEADWVVMNLTAPGPLDHVHVEEDGTRTCQFIGGEQSEYSSGWVDKVVETKTTKDLSWKKRKGPDEKHVYQVYPYAHALQCDAEIAYMTRNEWDELVIPVEYDDDMWMDCLLRAREHARNMQAEEGMVAPATPLDDSACHFCPFQHDCAANGGSEYL